MLSCMYACHSSHVTALPVHSFAPTTFLCRAPMSGLVRITCLSPQTHLLGTHATPRTPSASLTPWDTRPPSSSLRAGGFCRCSSLHIHTAQVSPQRPCPVTPIQTRATTASTTHAARASGAHCRDRLVLPPGPQRFRGGRVRDPDAVHPGRGRRHQPGPAATRRPDSSPWPGHGPRGGPAHVGQRCAPPSPSLPPWWLAHTSGPPTFPGTPRTSVRSSSRPASHPGPLSRIGSRSSRWASS